jgi:putative sigma-54 modulation protein
LELKIQTRNLEINDRVRQHITQKLSQINRHLPGITEVLVEVAAEPTRKQQDRIVVQVTLEVNGSILRGEQRASNTTAAINSVAEVLDRRIERYKSRAYRNERARQGGVALRTQQAEEAAQPPSEVAAEPLLDGSLVRIKRFDMKPLTVEEAAFQMQLLGHSFFMFLNSESRQYNVLYRRDDGNYGLLQPTAE